MIFFNSVRVHFGPYVNMLLASMLAKTYLLMEAFFPCPSFLVLSQIAAFPGFLR